MKNIKLYSILSILNKSMILIPFIIITSIVFTSCNESKNKIDIFSNDNLLAWCVVPFDAENRGPQERSRMLKDLGITKLAYDWRDEHIPSFDQEYKILNENGIRLQSFWMMSGNDPANDSRVHTVFDFLERNEVDTEIWLLVEEGEGFSDLNQNEKIASMAESVRYIAERAAKINCKVGLYNHGNWFGEPENQLAIIEHLDEKNVGIVFNFHHAASYQERFAEFFPKIKPHLYAINLAGLKKGDSKKFYEVGEGDAEQDMIRIIRASDYKGPIGIINHNTQRDAMIGLEIQMAGLNQILQSIEE
ncbi:sugar phosphate isomerase/epimerase family protein [Algoriphagus resistens]|uniref:sugar phosphate isomerase/epimerase family protein n=1 Tax=Algoriphagus resistens TaxID=1750590 RepID=UPI000716B148|nr:TIM barrel protein [Algoriphagus resistens]